MFEIRKWKYHYFRGRKALFLNEYLIHKHSRYFTSISFLCERFKSVQFSNWIHNILYHFLFTQKTVEFSLDAGFENKTSKRSYFSICVILFERIFYPLRYVNWDWKGLNFSMYITSNCRREMSKVTCTLRFWLLRDLVSIDCLCVFFLRMCLVWID